MDPDERSCEDENQVAMVGELTKLEDTLKRAGCWEVNEGNALRTERYSVVYESSWHFYFVFDFKYSIPARL